MPKAGEITYLQMVGAESVQHALDKPFSDKRCGQYLMALGAIRMYLPAPPARLLDLGCGTGWTSCLFGKMGYEVVAQDISPDMIYCANVNKQRYQTPSVRFLVCDYEGLELAEEFDAAVFFDSLHHAENERLALEAVYRALRPGGICVTHEPGEGHAEAEASRRAAERFNVTEKDMPPHHITALATEIGFSNYCCYPFPDQLIEHVAGCVTDAATYRQLSRRRQLLRPRRDVRNMTRHLGQLFARVRTYGGLVVLTK